jgi:hypothetical protein
MPQTFEVDLTFLMESENERSFLDLAADPHTSGHLNPAPTKRDHVRHRL